MHVSVPKNNNNNECTHARTLSGLAKDGEERREEKTERTARERSYGRRTITSQEMEQKRRAGKGATKKEEEEEEGGSDPQKLLSL